MSKSKRPVTVDDLWSMKRFGPSTLSPDGRWACASVTSYSMETNEATAQLWLFATDGSTQRQLTSGQKDGDPQWSPDGRWIAFTSRRPKADGAIEEEAQLYLIAADGGEAMKVSDVATGVSALRWFPDSARIAFVSWVWPVEKGSKAQAKRMKAERDDKVKAYAIERNHYRYWDHWFLRDREPHIHVAALPMAAIEGGLPTNATVRDLFEGTSFRLPPQEADASLFDISPDGGEIAFTYDFDPDPRAPAFTDVVLMDVKKGKWTSPTRNTGRAEEQPRYSPDGKWIAIHSSDLARAHNEQPRLALIRRSDHAIVPMTFAWDRGLHGVAQWTRDSKRVLLLAEDEVAQPIWAIDAPAIDDASPDPGEPRELLRGPRHGGVAADLAIGSDGMTLVYSRSSQTHPPSLFACDADGSRERAIEALNAPVLERIATADTHSVTIAGFDGDPVQMWVITPPGFELGGSKPGKKGKDAKRWPLMHTIHGGPHTCSNDAWHWRWNTQLFAAQGYVVASVNYHGSTGWGQEFICSINGDWGRRELADVEAGTEYLLNTGAIDPKRVTATGGSYGGYMVALMNGRAVRKRYAAYVCHAGCFDWVSMMGSDGYFWFGHELGGFPWEDEARVLAQSPHHYAAAFDTPTLVIHGELDYRVPYYQGLAYYNTLRVKRVPSRLLCYPDENHWILKPQNSRLWYREFFDWLTRYAGPSEGKAKRAGRKSH
jgi:dipeptidyl aminopeptidase/acylaminoacyl peptidase